METTRLYIVRAEYAGDVSLHIFFSDGTSQTEHGNIVWGKNWDMIFPIEQLHKGVVALTKLVQIYI